jgi:uncharacterized protein YqgV (UPF0045/DUF77 family)
MGRVRLEFTVEPFTDGRLGPHVQAAIAAVTDRGLAVDVGPFSTSADADEAPAFDAARALLEAAFAEGAIRVSLQIVRIDEEAR